MRRNRFTVVSVTALLSACADVAAPPQDGVLVDGATSVGDWAPITCASPRRLRLPTDLIWDDTKATGSKCSANLRSSVTAPVHLTDRLVCALVTFSRYALSRARAVPGQFQSSDAYTPATVKIYEWPDRWYVVFASLEQELQLTAVVYRESGAVSVEYVRPSVYWVRVR